MRVRKAVIIADMHGIKVTFESVEHFLELMYGHSRVGEFCQL